MQHHLRADIHQIQNQTHNCSLFALLNCLLHILLHSPPSRDHYRSVLQRLLDFDRILQEVGFSLHRGLPLALVLVLRSFLEYARLVVPSTDLQQIDASLLFQHNGHLHCLLRGEASLLEVGRVELHGNGKCGTDCISNSVDNFLLFEQ